MIEPTALQNELRAMSARMLELEHERSEARDQAKLLASLQEAYAQIAVTRAPDAVIALMLQAAYRILGFSRAIFFVADRVRGIEARWQVNGSDVVEESRDAADVRPGSAILAALRDSSGNGFGRAGELSAPLVDVNKWYVLAPLTHAEGMNALLYVDGHSSLAPQETEIRLVRALATITGVSYQNSLLFSQTQDLADRDPLTGLYNRRAFQQRLLHETQNSRDTGRGVAYVMIDVDNFKAVNDTLGHLHGDGVLKRLADVLTHGARVQDVVGRYAGDEFVVLFVGVDRALAEMLVERLSATLRDNELRCSLGAALYPDDANDALTLVDAADRALYETKRAGKNGFRFARR